MNLNKEQLTRAYTIIDGKNAKISQLEKERDELKARVKELEALLYEVANMIRSGDEDYACMEITSWYRLQGGQGYE